MNKLKKNEAGISAKRIVILIAFIIASIFIGWSVLHPIKNSNTTATDANTSNNSTDSNNSSSTTTTRLGADNSIVDPTDVIQPYKLPTGWKEKECQSANIAIIPPKTDDPDCEASQPNLTVVMYVADNYSFIDPENCAVTQEKRDIPNDGATAYGCTEIVINGKKGIKETKIVSIAGVSGEGNYTTYIFPTNGKLFVIEYAKSKDSNVPDYTKQFDDFVATIKFK